MKSMKIVAGVIFVALLFVAILLYFFYPTLYGIKPDTSNTPRLSDLPSPSPTTENSATPSSQLSLDVPVETIITEGLDTPWAIAFLPDNSMLVTERKGTVRLVDKNGILQTQPVAALTQVKEIGEGGLLGLTLHPDFQTNSYIYLYYTFASSGENTLNRVIRMTYRDQKLTNEEIIVDKIPGASNHNGGRIKFGPDKFLYITTGDAQEPSIAQSRISLGGKILRITDEGGIPIDNPFDNLIYSYGHRNPQGLAWSGDGKLWETEHGPSGGSLGTGNDEVNFIEAGKNYGWPEIQGDQTREGMVAPVKFSTPSISWAPGGTAVFEDTLYFSGLRGQALYRAKINGSQLGSIEELFKGKFGRIREVITGPDGMLYITTSNKDGRGVPGGDDDRIIRINPTKL